MKSIFIYFALFCCFIQFATAQNNATATLVGKIFDTETQPITFANVVLYAKADSSMAKVEVTNENGTFRMEGIAPATYWLETKYIGFETYRSKFLDLKAGQVLNLPTINLAGAATDLETVEVKAQRALIEVQPDKTVFNVDGSINATGNTALELLRKSPGVVVDNNDNIILSGKNGVQIYIDGKPSPLGMADLAAQLRAMQSSEIDAIEIITNPSAKYDAEGNAGIINIRLKKDKSLGFNANVNLGYARGINARYNASTNFNYRNKKANIFGTYSFNDGKSQSWIDLYRIQNKVLYDQQSVTVNDGANNSLKLGTDFFLNKKSTLGLMVNGYVNDRNWVSTNFTPISNFANGSPIDTLRYLDARSENDGIRQNLNANINYQFDNQKGVTWNIDADWGIFRNDTETYQPNFYRAADGETYQDTIIATFQAPTDIDIYTFKIDHERKLWGGQLGAGLKFSYVKTDNTYDFYNVEEGVEVLDIDRTNNFVFDENINAAYLSFTKSIKKYTLNLGLRAEQTNSEGVLTALKPTNNDRVARHYLNFFPSAGISYQADPKNQLRFNYSRRIDRPSYQDLNPFEFKLSEISFAKGNPFLQPQYTHNVSVSHTFNYRLTSSLSYSHTTDFFANISDSLGTTRSFLQTINLDFQKVISLTVSAPFSPKDWWNTYTNISAFRTHNRADLGEGRIVDVRAATLSLYHQSTFQLPKDFSLEVSGWYSSPSIWGAVYKTDAIYSVNAGVQKRLWKNRATLKVSISDIFLTTPWHGVQDFAGFYVDASGGWESRVVRVNFSYLLGNNQVKKTRKRETGLEEEVKRVK